MQYAKLGGTGLTVSRMCLGTVFRSGVEEEARCIEAIRKAEELGCNFLDTANFYQEGGAEAIVGKAVAGRRDKFVISTKVGAPMTEDLNGGGLTRKAIFREVEASLKRLNTDYIDCYLCHFPDPETPLIETVRAMDDLVRQGKIRYPGVSNHPAWMLCETMWTADRINACPPVVNQVAHSLLGRGIEKELIPFCQKHEVGITLFATTEIGLLSGRCRYGQAPPEGTSWHRGPYNYKAAMTPEVGQVIEAVIDIAEQRGKTPSQVAMAWCLTRPAVTAVITGSDTPERVESNFGAVDWDLSEEEVRRLDDISKNVQLVMRKDAPDGYRED